jgi:hypothetical protein
VPIQVPVEPFSEQQPLYCLKPKGLNIMQADQKRYEPLPARDNAELRRLLDGVVV